MATIVGIQKGKSKTSGNTVTTLHLNDDCKAYQNDPATGRSFTGKIAYSEYVGEFDTSNLKLGMDIDILYDKSVPTSNGGNFQPVKRIDIITK